MACQESNYSPKESFLMTLRIIAAFLVLIGIVVAFVSGVYEDGAIRAKNKNIKSYEVVGETILAYTYDREYQTYEVEEFEKLMNKPVFIDSPHETLALIALCLVAGPILIAMITSIAYAVFYRK